MASSLTATSLKSLSLYFVLLVMIVLGAIYFLHFKQPNVIDSLNTQAFRLNYSAFENGIKLANYQFIIRNAQQVKNNGNMFDIWTEGDIGLDYNNAGFPIGTDILRSNQQAPASSNDCLRLWQFVMGPLQPKILLKPDSGGYWTQLSFDNSCIFYSSDVPGLEVHYFSDTGKVSLIHVN